MNYYIAVDGRTDAPLTQACEDQPYTNQREARKAARLIAQMIADEQNAEYDLEGRAKLERIRPPSRFGYQVVIHWENLDLPTVIALVEVVTDIQRENQSEGNDHA